MHNLKIFYLEQEMKLFSGESIYKNCLAIYADDTHFCLKVHGIDNLKEKAKTIMTAPDDCLVKNKLVSNCETD